MIDYVFLGPTPYAEDCAQLGAAGYSLRSRVEIRAYLGQLHRIVQAEGRTMPAACSLVSKAESHDFGSYKEAAVRFDCDDETAVDFAYWLKSNTPEHWDAEALGEIQRAPGELLTEGGTP